MTISKEVSRRIVETPYFEAVNASVIRTWPPFEFFLFVGHILSFKMRKVRKNTTLPIEGAHFRFESCIIGKHVKSRQNGRKPRIVAWITNMGIQGWVKEKKAIHNFEVTLLHKLDYGTLSFCTYI